VVERQPGRHKARGWFVNRSLKVTLHGPTVQPLPPSGGIAAPAHRAAR